MSDGMLEFRFNRTAQTLVKAALHLQGLNPIPEGANPEPYLSLLNLLDAAEAQMVMNAATGEHDDAVVVRLSQGQTEALVRALAVQYAAHDGPLTDALWTVLEDISTQVTADLRSMFTETVDELITEVSTGEEEHSVDD